LAARQDQHGWNSLLGGVNVPQEVVVPEMATEVEYIPVASQESQLIEAAHRLAKGSVRKATQSLNSKGVAPDMAFVRHQLQELNPFPSQAFQETDDTSYRQWDLSPAEVKKTLGSMNNDAAPGPSGLTVQSLKRVMATEEGANSVTTIVNRIVNGNETNTLGLLGATLVPLIKSPSKVRPIAIGEVITRLGAKALLRKQSKELSQFLRPIQQGVREPAGTEKTIHAVRKQYQAGKAVLSLDIKNAFNSLSRERIRQTLQNHLPYLLPYFQWAYKNETPLWFNGDLLAYSYEGVRQGDPLGPALFAVGFHSVLRQLQEEFPTIDLFAYLDDLSATGNPEELVGLATRFEELSASCGLTVNLNKSVLLLPSNGEAPQASRNIPVRRDGITILGSPVGTAEFEEESCCEKVRQLNKLFFIKTEDEVAVQSRYVLLKDSVLPTLNHIWRTVPPWTRQQATTVFDNQVQEIMFHLLGADSFSDVDHVRGSSELHLPLRHGGLGLTRATDISVAAYVASTWEAGIIQDSETISMLVARLQTQGVSIDEEDLKQPAPNRKQQRWMVDQVMHNRVQTILYGYHQDGNEAAKARLRAAQQPGSHDWISVLPTSHTKSFSDMQWRLGARLRIGLRVSRRPLPTTCPLCLRPIEEFEHHAFQCLYSEMKTARTERHNNLRDALIGALSAWGFETEKEPIIQQGKSFRGDVGVIQPHGPCIIDISVIHPSPLNTQQNLSVSAATLVREKEKYNYYGSRCNEVQKWLLPFAFQTFGGIGKKALDFFTDLKSRPACLRVFDPVNYTFAIRQNLSCRLMQANANLLLRWLQLVLPMSRGGVAYSST
jgi:hypothetical protein